MVQPRLGGALRQIDRLFSGASVVGLSDASLLARFVASGDEDAFAVIVARHGPLVWSVCRDVLRDPIDVEDAFQATFLILIRRSRSLRVDESLAGWLYRVAHRLAVRASVTGVRRRGREQSGLDLDSVAEPSRERGKLAELHEAIARLPERYRQAIVLCELEGMTQIEAATALNCGEATVRRRLAEARQRLRARLASHGEVGSFLALARIANTPQAAVAWGQRIPSATAELLARKASLIMMSARLIKMGVVAVGMALATASTVAYTFKAVPIDEPKPIVQPQPQPKPRPAKPLAPIHWVHLTSDIRGETWANLDEGREFHKEGQTVTMLEARAHDLFTYTGNGSIVKTKANYYADVVDKAGRTMPPSAFELAGWIDLDSTQRASDEERKTARSFSDYEFETIDDRHYFRNDQYQRDALGEVRLEFQIWYDRETKRPVRSRERLQVAYQTQYKREFETTVYDYPETGPADLAALGVPKDTPIVDLEKTERSGKWADLPPGLQTALKAQADALRRFPRNFRAVSLAGNILQLEYWSAAEEFVELWSETRTSDRNDSLEKLAPRHFRADQQEYQGLSRDRLGELFGTGDDDLPVDRIVAWFPFDRSINMGLEDGKRTYNLTRYVTEAKKPRKVKLHVLGRSFARVPQLVDDLWPTLDSNKRYITLEPAEADTPAGMLVIKFHQPEPEYRTVYTLDPAHDFIAVHQVEWSYNGDEWHKRDKKAIRFKQLPGGSWYVSAWEERAGFGGNPDQPAGKNEATLEVQRLEITPLEPDEFPKDIFDGDRFLESARKEGAVIKVDQ